MTSRGGAVAFCAAGSELPGSFGAVAVRWEGVIGALLAAGAFSGWDAGAAFGAPTRLEYGFAAAVGLGDVLAAAVGLGAGFAAAVGLGAGFAAGSGCSGVALTGLVTKTRIGRARATFSDRS
jgi:hypothetical protein